MPAEGRIDVVTIFPEYLAPLDLSLVGKARRDGLVRVDVHDLRRWAQDRHRTVDDTPAGGGAGMVMRPDVWGRALDEVVHRGAAPRTVVILPTPAGEPLVQRTAEDLAERLRSGAQIVIACGRYEGIDARVAEHYAQAGDVEVRELSIGDYVLGGGEVAALVVVECLVRLLPGVLGNPRSLADESHGVHGLLEAPVYTRPLVWRDLAVPEVLRSGHHERIRRWRRDRALERTARRRPDLLARLDPGVLDAEDVAALARSGWEVGDGGVVPADAPFRSAPASVADSFGRARRRPPGSATGEPPAPAPTP